MTLFFTSDQHFDHNNIIEYCNRPFNSVNHMNEVMVANWNKVVGAWDTVVCVGDFSLKVSAAEKYVKRLNGYKILVKGNHDRCFRQERYDEIYRSFGFHIVCSEMTIKTKKGSEFFISHFPYRSEDVNERYHLQRPLDQGMKHLCGHVHNSWAIKGNEINVGVDVRDFTPISLEELDECF